MKKIQKKIALLLTVSLGMQACSAYGMYRLSKGIRRGVAALSNNPQKNRLFASYAHYKPTLKNLALASGGLTALGGSSYGLFAYNKKILEEQQRQDRREEKREECAKRFENQLAENAASQLSWRAYIPFFFVRNKSFNYVPLDEDIVDEAKKIWEELNFDSPHLGFFKMNKSSMAAMRSVKVSTLGEPDEAFFSIGICPLLWKRTSKEEKKAVLAHEYGHWIYRCKHGFDVDPSKKEEESCDRFSVEQTGSSKGLVQFLEDNQRQQNKIMWISVMVSGATCLIAVLQGRQLAALIQALPILPGALLTDNIQLPSNLETMSSEDMQEIVEKLRARDNYWPRRHLRRMLGDPDHPINSLRIALAIQHEKRLTEQEKIKQAELKRNQDQMLTDLSYWG